ncbi:MAG: hypothetical protein HOP31_00805 [Ignavibacteria bacterium]|nr:hypothetical protein [Ignavibacteria bacterium]
MNMIKILIVDDSDLKIRNILKSIEDIIDIHKISCDVSSDRINALRLLKINQYDLMILDIRLPNRFGEDSIENGGLKLLNELEANKKYFLPFHIIGLTGYEDVIKNNKNRFENSLWFLIKYSESHEDWKIKLRNKLIYLISSKTYLKSNDKLCYDYDIGIITAIQDSELKKILELPANWMEYKISNDNVTYFVGIFKNDTKSFRVVAASSNQMGMTSSTLLTSKLISNFHPHYIIMAGKAAGVKQDGLNYGDILLPILTWDYSTGKLSENENIEIFEPENKPIPINDEIEFFFNEAIRKNLFLHSIRNSWNRQNIQFELNAKMGPFASGPLVITTSNKIDQIKEYQRKLIGIDMETYAVFYTCFYSSLPKPVAISIKSISDFADIEKDDTYEEYACYTSSQFIYNFILEFLEPVSR